MSGAVYTVASTRVLALVVTVVVSTLLAGVAVHPLSASEGYYRDVFIDGGCHLTRRTSLAAAEYLGLSQEALALPSGDPTAEHERIQAEKIVGNDDDTNGALLYPDGAPRFRLIQTNGGSATGHGRSLGEEGRQRVRDFYYAGGSYTGTCAGFFISTVAAYDDGINENYYHIWPGRVRPTGLLDATTGMFIEPGSPLLDYYDFGGDEYVADLYHNGGGYAEEDHPEWPDGTEILARFDNPGWGMHREVSCLAYKEDDLSGRLVIIGSHPEGVDSGERRDLMAAMMEYALDGEGEIQVKGALESGVWWTMDRYWEDADPLHTRIGDQQYHHFVVDVPAGASDLTVTLEGEEGYDLDLYLRRGDLAFESTAQASSTNTGANEEVTVAWPEAGPWYVGVHCDTEVIEVAHSWYVEYSGNVGVLNGVAYSIMAETPVSSALVLELPAFVAEDQGSASGFVGATPAPADDLSVHIESTDPGRVTVPSPIVLPAGRERVEFRLEVVDNLEHEGDTDVTIIACAAGVDCVSGQVTVNEDDDESPATVSCSELGGVCCPADVGCEDGQPTWDCDGRCCLSDGCPLPDDGDGQDGSDVPTGEPTGDPTGGAADGDGPSWVGTRDGCTCKTASGSPSATEGIGLALCLLALAWVTRRRSRKPL